MSNHIPVTQPFLPPREEYESLLADIWDRNWLTNNGPLVKRLEEELTDYLDVTHLSLVSNGTVALQIAMKALDLEGEIITTPFSYVATTSSIKWENYTPVFADIHPQTFNLDPAKIEDAVTTKTSAIIATHVYGNPCDIEGIRKVANKYNLKIIYDAAHCFGTKYNGQPIFNYGDISTSSFHATKLFHTVEGGALVTDNAALHNKINLMRNFGHDGLNNFTGVGINGKNSELHAAMGIVNLKYIDEVLARRKKLSRLYDDYLENVEVQKQAIQPNSSYNFCYYPVLFDSEQQTETVLTNLKEHNIQTRRYFYPLLSKLDYVTTNNSTPVAEKVSKRILCLPLYHELTEEDISRISEIIKEG
ncbi:dTDP-4-amino-4,6-dideoxygalactose transaminase [Fodinibius salinus]|uniref:dTDP-4-amino-4,6-dideoxygalactose transaminase n=1 Tax=Fodinibius salinus TaxID=860790 RepID=A0A5D3YH27_9BACT|nr:DegT/DnrJ/EryC1/StrS family aminotransferase [Fodinibius salinus]TYP91724.1 dTDP-4-amino-4,6-dideoxygalactose transaminase [Fodinibius salinus]